MLTRLEQRGLVVATASVTDGRALDLALTPTGLARRGHPTLRYSPVAPSTDSRMRSAWPLWRAYSSIMWSRIQRKLGAVPSGQVRWAS